MDIQSITSNPAVAFRFMVEFAQLDLEGASPRTLIKVQRQLQAFIHREEPATEITTAPVGRDELRELQKRAFRVLDGIADGGPITIVDTRNLVFWYIRPPGGAPYMRTRGPLLDRMLYQLLRVLQTVGAEKLLRCPGRNRGQRCGRLFLKVTQKRFCSTRCQARDVMQKKRAAMKAPQEKAHGKTTRTR
jgi:hypothetical protein